LSLFADRVKYPRTFHLPWSPGMNRDDRQMTDVSIFEGQQVMIVKNLMAKTPHGIEIIYMLVH
jgi:hypothetical protein